MRLTKVSVRNFRLLLDVSVNLEREKPTTVLVGPNNSGKTSMAEALSLFTDWNPREFTISDFSIAAHKQFDKFANDETALDEDAHKKLPPLPELTMALHFSYSESPEDLVVASDLLMDLDPQSYQVAIEIVFSVKDIVLLAKDYRASTANKKLSLLEFLAPRLSRYFGLSLFKLHPTTGTRELLPDGSALKKLIKVDFLAAQRHMDDKENAQATRLSRLLNDHYEKRYKVAQPAGYEALEQAVRDQSADLTGKYQSAFQSLKDSLNLFGYPQTPDLQIRAELTASAIFKDNTRVFYAAEVEAAAADVPAVTYDLPERFNGLGFKNLIFMVLQLKAFRDDVESSEAPRPRVHLIVVEEPEAHLHPQLQTLFIEKAGSFVGAQGATHAQLVLTTHSSHVVANCGLSPIRYFRRTGSATAVKDLLSFQNAQQATADKKALDFLIRYLTLNRCDLFFCQKAILIEGAVERLLLPRMIEMAAAANQGDLTNTHLAIIEVGGAYAHKFKELIHFIQVPTLVVTDIDSVTAKRTKCKVSEGSGSSNATLTSWLPKKSKLAELLAADSTARREKEILVAYQVPEEVAGLCGRSFEEAFVYANADWLLAEKAKLLGSGDLFTAATATALRNAAYDIQFPKVDFAMDLVMNSGWKTPRYIAEGLQWLAEQPQ